MTENMNRIGLALPKQTKPENPTLVGAATWGQRVLILDRAELTAVNQLATLQSPP